MVSPEDNACQYLQTVPSKALFATQGEMNPISHKFQSYGHTFPPRTMVPCAKISHTLISLMESTTWSLNYIVVQITTVSHVQHS